MAAFTVHLDENAGPASTHALVIGIGAYAHLNGGPSPTDHPGAVGLRQLSSPPLSARAFATWMIDQYHDEGRPLATLALLLSEAAPTPFVHPKTQANHVVESATIDNIVDAIEEWKDRGDHDEARLVFYFCGHGVSLGTDSSLLAADMFADRNSPLNGALHFEALVRGLNNCRAAQQVFFVDACREGSDALVNTVGRDTLGRVVVGGNLRPAGFDPRMHAVLYSTMLRATAVGRAGGVSLFTDALLRSFDGSGSENIEDDVWRVTTLNLLRSTVRFMQEPSFAGTLVNASTPTSNESFEFDFHELRGDPVVPVYIGCTDPEDNARAEFICKGNIPEPLHRPPPDPDGEPDLREWAPFLPFGEYTVEAVLGPQDQRSKSLDARPPFFRVRLARP
ncbi:caspase family protein [Streptomyces aureoverticillatus]|uniref:caspase family protein n=1 Tax=Streptomyces aureoverticillatus TaxID=66871 RepID=UPI0013DB6D12|nr:caspase family protein [Streptomyces aureoverticillatus]QIB47829.1 caspase family protein [Streptomyces aureoverticillatus]